MKHKNNLEKEILNKHIDFYKNIINILFAGYAILGLFSFLSIYQFNKELKEWNNIRYELNEKIKKIEIKIYQLSKEEELLNQTNKFKTILKKLEKMKLESQTLNNKTGVSK